MSIANSQDIRYKHLLKRDLELSLEDTMAQAYYALMTAQVLGENNLGLTIPTDSPWVQEDNAQVYDMNIANRTVRGGYPVNESILASPQDKRHILGIVGGNDVSRMAGNPQDIESDLRGITRPLTKCNEREYQPLVQGQTRVEIDNRKTKLALDIRPVHLPEYQMWAYPTAFAPLPLKKQGCDRPEKY